MPQNWTTRRRLFPSLSDLVFSTTLLYLVLIGKGATALLSDSDTGWHIRTGDWILSHLAVPRLDLFSFSKPGGQWFAWEWGSDVLFALIHRYAGLGGLVLLAGLVIASVFALLYRFMLRRGANVVLAAALALVASYAASIHWLARPHMFSWVFALAFYWMLEETPVEGGKIFWLVPLTALWTNLHGSFVLGLFLIGLYGVGELLRAVLAAGDDAAPRRRQSFERAGRYVVLLAACGAASLLNPYFYRVHLHIFAYLKDPYVFDHIGEFFSPNFHTPDTRFFEVLLLLGLGGGIWAVRQGRYTQALLVLTFAHLGLQSARHIPLYVIFAAPVIAAALTEALAGRPGAMLAGWLEKSLGGFERFSADIRELEIRPRFYATSGLATLLVVALLWAPASAGELKDFRPQFSAKTFPAAAADYLEKASFQGNIFTTDQWSSYLIYRFFPRIRVFMDGRSDYYGGKLGEQYLNVLGVHHTWQATLNEYGVDSILLPVDSGLAGALKETALWKVAYDDGVAILFYRTDTAAAQLVAAVDGATKRSQEDR